MAQTVLDPARQHLQSLPSQSAEPPPEPRVARRVQCELEVQEQPVPIPAQGRGRVGGRRLEPVTATARGAYGLPKLARPARDAVLVERQEQVLLALEVRVDRARGEARLRRDRLDGCAVESASGERAARRIEDRTPDLLAGWPADTLTRRSDRDTIPVTTR